MTEKIKHDAKNIFGSTFWQLLVVYTALVVLISFSLFWRYTFHFEIFAVIIAVIGAFALYHYEVNQKESLDKWLHYCLFALGIVLIFTFRILPYVGNDIPPGYDAGIYKFGIENFAAKGFSADSWVIGAMSPGLLYLLAPLVKMGISSEFILIWGFILFCVLLGYSIYLAAREYFGVKTAVIALLLYAVSAIQFKVFTYLYYKNVVALACLFFALYFLEKSNRVKLDHDPLLDYAMENPKIVKPAKRNYWGEFWKLDRILFIVFGTLVGVMHLPTFFIFGISYLLFLFNNRRDFWRKFLDGFLILAFSLLLYAGFWKEAILPLIAPVAESFVEPGTAPGTFISFFVYQFSTLYILPFAMLGFVHLFWQKRFNMIFFLTFVAGAIVYFQFFFFNRFIIHLDVFLILLAASAFSLMIANAKKLGLAILVLMIISSGYVTLRDSLDAKPLISQEDLALIKMIDSNVEGNAYVMVVTSEYSPWVLAYSNRRTIAPGLFEEKKWSQIEWERFWAAKSEEETRSLMAVYPEGKPIYLYVGTKSFNNPCLREFLSNGSSKLLRYECG